MSIILSLTLSVSIMFHQIHCSHSLTIFTVSLPVCLSLSIFLPQYLNISRCLILSTSIPSASLHLSLSFLLYTLSTPQSSSLVYNFFIFLSLNGFLSIPSPSHTRTSMPVFVSELRSVLRFSTSDSSEHHGEVLVTVSRQQCVCAALQDSHGAEMRCLCGG